MDNVIEFKSNDKAITDEILNTSISSPEELVDFINKYSDYLTCIKTTFSLLIEEEAEIVTKTSLLSNESFDEQQINAMLNTEIEFTCDFKKVFIDGDT